MPNDVSTEAVTASIANTQKSISLDDLVNKARDLSDLLAAGPCADAQAGEVRCFDRENNLARRQGQGFTAYRHDRMCEACSAFWFAEMASLTLEHTLWLDRMLAARIVRTKRLVTQIVDKVELPLAVSMPLAKAIEGLMIDSFEDEVPPVAFVAVAKACHELEGALTQKVAELEQHLADQREHLADEVVMGDDVELRRLERHRARLASQQEQQLNLLKMVRELSPAGGSGSLGQPVLVELRLVGRRTEQ